MLLVEDRHCISSGGSALVCSNRGEKQFVSKIKHCISHKHWFNPICHLLLLPPSLFHLLLSLLQSCSLYNSTETDWVLGWSACVIVTHLSLYCVFPVCTIKWLAAV